MTSTTLSVTRSTQLNAAGSGTIILRPDVGQNWGPLFVRVSTNNINTPVAYCAVYHGSPGVPVQQSQFIDDTFDGNGDTSSMIAGTPVLYGEAILFQFTGGNPGDTAIASVYGQTSDLPPNLDLVPQVPGTHFTGHLTTETLSQIDGRTFLGITPAVFQQGPIKDVRQFGSYNLQVQASFQSGPGAFAPPVYVEILWLADSAGLQPLFTDVAEFWGSIGAFPFPNLFIQDTMHGPYMRVRITNNSAADTINAGYTLNGSTRLLSQPYFRQGQYSGGNGTGFDGILLSVPNTVVGAGTTTSIPCPFSYGRYQISISNAGPSAAAITLAAGSQGGVFGYNIAAGAVDTREVIMPKRSMNFQIAAAAGGLTFNAHANTLFDKV